MLTCPRRSQRSLTAGAIACVVLAAIASAVRTADARQDSTGLPQAIISSSSALNEGQRRVVSAFVEGWVRDMATGDPAQVARGRNELAQPPARPGSTQAFHRDYAAILRPMLDPIVHGDDEFRAVNAIIVLRSLRTPEAVEALVRLTAPRSESRAVIRVRAAGLLVDAVADAPLNPAQLDRLVRDIAEFAGSDPEWVAAYHGFRTLSRIAGRDGLPQGSVTLALDSQVGIVRRLVERAERQPGPSEAVEAIARSLLVARDQLPSLAPDSAAILRRGLAAPLARFAKVAAAHWDTARATPETSKTYADALTAANLLLRLEATARQRQLTVDLGAKWRADDREGFAADVAAVQTLASGS